MKLPEDRQQRIKVFVMIGLGAVLVVLGIVQGIISPLVRAHRNKVIRLAESQEGLERARREIRAAARSFTRRMESIEEIKRISDRYVLHPVLGNYLLSATAVIDRHALAAGVPIEPVREIGISEIPGEDDKMIKAYSVRVNAQCGYLDILRLVREIETGNPFVSVTSVVIRGAPEANPELHNTSLEVQWPIWADPGMAGRLELQLDEEVSDPEDAA